MQVGEHLVLAAGTAREAREVQPPPQADGLGHRRVRQFFERSIAQRAQHFTDLVLGGADVTRREDIGWIEQTGRIGPFGCVCGHEVNLGSGERGGRGVAGGRGGGGHGWVPSGGR